MTLSTLVVVVALVSAASAQDKPSIEESTKKVKELQKERIAALKAAAEISQKLAQAFRLDISEAMENRMTLLKAELEAAETESDRIALYKKALEDLKACEQLAKDQFAAARATELPLHKVKARRLEIEIALEQAKIKQAKEKK